MQTPYKQIVSPCIRNCCLNDNDQCLGCFRALDEIKSWFSLANSEKQQVLESCQQRRLSKQAYNQYIKGF